MSELRKAMTSLGYSDVRTLLNSGNAVFDSKQGSAANHAAQIEEAIATQLGIEAKTVVLSAGDFAKVVQANPLLDVADNPSRFFVAFVQQRSKLSQLMPLAKSDWGGEALAVGSHAAYVWCPEGIIESKAMKALSRSLGDSVTTRNWATVGKIAALLESE